MTNIKLQFVICHLMITICCFTYQAWGQENQIHDPFELTDGDRVVLLGNALMENDLKNGYIEYALTTRWPDRDITFRNLGWSGDTVFGEARGYYTTPPDAYGHLILQLEEAAPTVVFVAYGAVEAFEGEAGIPRFEEGLLQLIDKIGELGAKPVLLSPIPQFPVILSIEETARRNEMLQQYGRSIEKVAGKYGLRYLDLFRPMQKIGRRTPITINGVHLNELGYFYLAGLIERKLDLPPREWVLSIDSSSDEVENSGLSLSELSVDSDGLEFKIAADLLPLPMPDQSGGLSGYGYKVKITNLPDGIYAMSAEGGRQVGASAGAWAKGVVMGNGAAFRQAAVLRDLIINKNEFFFHQYRPQNRTYLTGFRSHEQGHNVTELKQLDEFISRYENLIKNHRIPEPQVYRLQRLDEEEARND